MSIRPERSYISREAKLWGNIDHSAQEQDMGQANRDVSVNMLWSCGYFTLLSFSVLPSIPPTIRLSPHCSLILQQMMQQQAALMAATQGSYLNPMAAIAAAQMQQMAAFNVNGLVATPMTPSSGIHQHVPLTGSGATAEAGANTRSPRMSLSIPHYCPGTFLSLARIIDAVVIYSFKAFLLSPLLLVYYLFFL